MRQDQQTRVLLEQLLAKSHMIEAKLDQLASELRAIKRAVTEPHNPTWFHRGGK